MTRKVMAIVAGRKGGNSEALAKVALERLQAKGAEVVFVNLFDYDILPCTGCEGCTAQMRAIAENPEKKYKGCILKKKDDVDALVSEMHTCNGVIFIVPTYDLMPSSLYLRFAQRFLAYEQAFLLSTGIMEEDPHTVAGVVSVGGSPHDWQSLALEGLQATMFTMSIQVIDRYLVTRVPRPGGVFMREGQIERMQEMAEHIWQAVNTPVEERGWLGDPDDGVCPNCHSSLVFPGEEHWDGTVFPWECAVCSCGGEMGVNPNTGKPMLLIDPEKGHVSDRCIDEARARHLQEIMLNTKHYYEHLHEVADEIERYRAMEFPTVTVER